MKNWKRLLALLLSGAMALSLFACKSGDSAESPSPDPSDEVSANPDANPSATPEIVADLSQGVLEFSAGMSAGDTALTINGEDVPADLFLYWLDYNCYYFMSYYGMLGYRLSDYADDMMEEASYFCISQILMRQKAAELGCLPTDAQVKEAQDSLEDETREMLQSGYGLSDDSINVLILSSAYYDNLLAALTHEPTTEELNRDYLYRVKHILLKTVDDNRQPLPEDQIAEKKAQAEELLAELQAASDLPALFDQRMNELSEDGRDDSSGALYAPDGYLAAPGDMVPEFEAASKALEVGGLSGIVESTYGYHIILRLPTDVTAEELAAHPEYAENFRSDAMDELLVQWEDAADITRADALSNLNPEDFYSRLTVYQQALYAEDTSTENDPSTPATTTASPSSPTKGESNALGKAKQYLQYSAFSYSGLISQLEYEGYSHSEAVYGADNCGADWNEQAAKKAAQYLAYSSFSRSGLIEQLEYEGFTHSQAVYGVEQNGY